MTTAVTASEMDRKAVRNGIYINPVLEDTVTLVNDSIYLSYKHKITSETDSSSIKDSIARVASANIRRKKNRARISQPLLIIKPKQDIASTYTLLKDSVELELDGGNKKRFIENLSHIFKKKPINGNINDEVKIEDNNAEKKFLKYHMTLNHDTLRLNNGDDKSQFVQYVKH